MCYARYIVTVGCPSVRLSIPSMPAAFRSISVAAPEHSGERALDSVSAVIEEGSTQTCFYYCSVVVCQLSSNEYVKLCHVAAQTTAVDQSAPSSAVYVISPQHQVPVTSLTSPAPDVQLRMLNGGTPLVLLLAGSAPALNQHGVQHGDRHERELECSRQNIGDVTADNVSGCSGEEELRKCKTECRNADNQSTSSPGTRDHQQNTYDLHMWRPW